MKVDKIHPFFACIAYTLYNISVLLNLSPCFILRIISSIYGTPIDDSVPSGSKEYRYYWLSLSYRYFNSHMVWNIEIWLLDITILKILTYAVHTHRNRLFNSYVYYLRIMFFIFNFFFPRYFDFDKGWSESIAILIAIKNVWRIILHY